MTKIYSGIMGLVVGDALGVPVEFNRRDSFHVTDMIGYGTYDLPPGTWSDDSSMTLATVESIARLGHISTDDIMQNFYRWTDANAFTPYGKLFDMHDFVQTVLYNDLAADDPEDAIAKRNVLFMKKLAKIKAYRYMRIYIGDAYERGSGVPKDINKAIKWFKKAAKGGIKFGNECIGMIYFQGNDLPTDYKKAFKYFTKDNCKKSFCTIYALGEMFRNTRPKIAYMREIWGKNLFIKYLPLNDDTIIEKVERELLRVIIPPCNTQIPDYDVIIGEDEKVLRGE